MKKKKSIKTIIFVAVLGGLIPVNLLTILIYSWLYGYISNTVIETYQNSLYLYAEQNQNQLESAERYVKRMVSGNNWDGLRYESGSKEYELDKINLKFEISDGTSESYWNGVDSIYVYIKHTGEIIEGRNTAKISIKENDENKEWMRTQALSRWGLVTPNETTYLSLNLGNSIYHLGIFIKPETVLDTWTKNSGFDILLANTVTEIQRDGYYAIATPFMSDQLQMVTYIPVDHIKKSMPIQYMLLFLSIFAGACVVFILVILLQRHLILPLKNMENTILKINDGQTNVRVNSGSITNEMLAIEGAFNMLMDNIYNLEIKNYEMEIENQKAQLMNLQLQINPHLLLNTLNIIYGLSEIEEYKSIQTFTRQLVQYFRYSLKRTDEFVTVKQELEFVKNYEGVQLVRYPESFYVVYDVEQELLEEKIPPLIIENFVENSAKYSVKQKKTEVLIIIKKRENYLHISICDDGVGIDDSILRTIREEKYYEKDGEVHVGIWNCIRRLHLFYGEAAKFSITSAIGEGTQVWMEIPCTKGGDPDESTYGG